MRYNCFAGLGHRMVKLGFALYRARAVAALVTTGAALLFLAAPAYGQVLQTQQGSNGNQGATKSVALTLPKSATKASLFGVQVVNTCTTQPTIKDTIGNTFVLDKSYFGQQGATAFHAINIASLPDTITATFASACSYAAIFVEEVNGLSGAVDSFVMNNTAALAGTVFTVGPLTTTGADFIVAVGDNNYGVGGFVPVGGFTLVPANASPGAAEYQTAPKAGTYSVSFVMKQAGYKATGLAIAYAPSGVTPPPPNTCTGSGTLQVNGSTTPLSMASTFTMPSATTGVAYSASIATAASVTGGVSPYTYAILSGSLPSGLTMNTAGIISGAPGGAGTFSFTVQVTDSSGSAMNIDFQQKVELARRLQDEDNNCRVSHTPGVEYPCHPVF
jgi:hypothetical protein